MKKGNSAILLLFITLVFTSCSKKTPLDYVNPMIGTGGHGHTYPGASSPFGMVQLTPSSRLHGWDGCSGYHYSDDTLYGFVHTALSGTGVSDYGDLLFMPYNKAVVPGKPLANRRWLASGFSHKKEKASPGFYAVKLKRDNIDVSLTVTPRCGLHKYEFSNTSEPKVFLDLKHRDRILKSSLTIESNTRIAGSRISTAWAKEQHIYFVAEFSEPFQKYIIMENDSVQPNINSSKADDIKASFSFADGTKEILLRVGISAVSIENAAKNLEQELSGLDFESVKAEVQQAWLKELSRIEVEGGTEDQKTTFYTALYHSFLAPNLYMDVNNEYRGRDMQIHKADGFTNYTIFSLWDTYRATHPLYTILQQRRTNDFIRTFIRQYEQDGELPVWELAANETDCMIGYHSVSVIADAYIKGIRDYNAEKAFEAMKASAEQSDWGIEAYYQTGFVPAEVESESVSKTLEYAYDDWCIAQMAKAMGKDKDYKRYLKRAQYYQNLFNPANGFMQPRIHNQWKQDFKPTEVDNHFTEANSWQYSFYAPQDISGLINLHGSDEAFNAKLDELFNSSPDLSGRKQPDITGLIGQYAHGNEPSHHMAYLYNFSGEAWKTQMYARRIMDEMYRNAPDGLSGNEDCGQMSSWYVFSAMGFYPVTPGSKDYIIGTPLFRKASIKVADGKNFSIIANGISEKNIYIQSAKLNGKEYSKSYISHEQIMEGGELVFEMGAEPNKSWGTAINDRPATSIAKEHQIIRGPWISGISRSFSEPMQLRIHHPDPEAKIWYALNDTSSFKQYKGPVTLTSTTEIFVYAEKHGKQSKRISSKCYRRPEGLSIDIKSTPGSQYTAGGEHALIDGIRGAKDFRLGDWQGYQYDDFVAIVKLDRAKTIHSITAGFLQDQNSWIFMPVEISFYTSMDGKDYKKAATITPDISPKHDEAVIRDYTAETSVKARFVKVVAKNLKYCPQWHKGYPFDGQAFIFIDEIMIN